MVSIACHHDGGYAPPFMHRSHIIIIIWDCTDMEYTLIQIHHFFLFSLSFTFFLFSFFSFSFTFLLFPFFLFRLLSSFFLFRLLSSFFPFFLFRLLTTRMAFIIHVCVLQCCRNLKDMDRPLDFYYTCYAIIYKSILNAYIDICICITNLITIIDQIPIVYNHCIMIIFV